MDNCIILGHATTSSTFWLVVKLDASPRARPETVESAVASHSVR